MMVYPIPPGLFCVPSAIIALTGADLESVVIPALNRAQETPYLRGPIAGVSVPCIEAVLRELRCKVRHYKSGNLRAPLSTWATRSLKYPGRTLLVCTVGHALVIADGKIYDTYTPYGEAGDRHPCSHDTVVYAALIESASSTPD